MKKRDRSTRAQAKRGQYYDWKGGGGRKKKGDGEKYQKSHENEKGRSKKWKIAIALMKI
jgi:hypothetical protein